MGRRRGSAAWGSSRLGTLTEWVSSGPMTLRPSIVRQRGESPEGVETRAGEFKGSCG